MFISLHPSYLIISFCCSFLLQTDHRTGLVVSASSLGSMQLFRTDLHRTRLVRISASDWAPFSSNQPSVPLSVALSSLALSSDGNQVFVGDDLGRIAEVQLDRIPPFQGSNSSAKKQSGSPGLLSFFYFLLTDFVRL